jgi:hypothetical protein
LGVEDGNAGEGAPIRVVPEQELVVDHVAVERPSRGRKLHDKLRVHQTVRLLGLAGVGEAHKVVPVHVDRKHAALHDIEVPGLRVGRVLLRPDEAIVFVVPVP